MNDIMRITEFLNVCLGKFNFVRENKMFNVLLIHVFDMLIF